MHRRGTGGESFELGLRLTRNLAGVSGSKLTNGKSQLMLSGKEPDVALFYNHSTLTMYTSPLGLGVRTYEIIPFVYARRRMDPVGAIYALVFEGRGGHETYIRNMTEA